MNKNLLKLAKALLRLAEIATDKATLVYDGELVVGVEVFIEDENGELIAPEDGEYATEDKIYVIASGKVEEIRDKEANPNPDPENLEDEKDAKIAELEAAVAEKDAELAQKQSEMDEKDARIAELEAENEKLKARIAEGEAKSAEEELKMNKTPKQHKQTIVFNQF